MSVTHEDTIREGAADMLLEILDAANAGGPFAPGDREKIRARLVNIVRILMHWSDPR